MCSISFLDYKNFNLEKIDEISWDTHLHLKNILTLFNNSISTLSLEDREKKIELELKLFKFKSIIVSYKPSLCQIIWCIINLTFTYFKVQRVRKQLQLFRTSAAEWEVLSKIKWNSEKKQKLLQRKIKIIDLSLKLIQQNSDHSNSLVKKTGKIFQEMLRSLEEGIYVPFGEWSHATKEECFTSILNSKTLLEGNFNLYGPGVYFSSRPESEQYYNATKTIFDEGDDKPFLSYGDHIVALDNLAFSDENTNSFFVSFSYLKHIFVVAGNPQQKPGGKNYLPFDHQTAMLVVNDDKVDEVEQFKEKSGDKSLQKIRVVSYQLFSTMRNFYRQAEDQLGGVELPENCARHVASRDPKKGRFISVVNKKVYG